MDPGWPTGNLGESVVHGLAGHQLGELRSLSHGSSRTIRWGTRLHSSPGLSPCHWLRPARGQYTQGDGSRTDRAVVCAGSSPRPDVHCPLPPVRSGKQCLAQICPRGGGVSAPSMVSQQRSLSETAVKPTTGVLQSGLPSAGVLFLVDFSMYHHFNPAAPPRWRVCTYGAH